MSNEQQSSGFLHWLQVIAIGRNPKRTLVRLLVLVVLAVVTFKFILLPVRVTGQSMEPTFANGGVNFINRMAYRRAEPQRGDVVGIRMATDAKSSPKVMLLKRIVGLPGETVSFAGGHVCIDGVRQTEPYLKLPSDWEAPGVTLGPDQYYFVGDNRSMPIESHEHGVADRSRIVGKVLFHGKQ